MSTDAPTEVPRQSRDSGAASDAWNHVVTSELNPNALKPTADQISALNQTLQDTQVLPDLTITDITDNPATANNPNDRSVTLTSAGDPASTINATYDPDQHMLAFERPAVLPGHLNGSNENVVVNMLTGEETVKTPGLNGTTRTTTREYVGAPASTTLVSDQSNPPRVVQTEATNARGSTTVTKIERDASGNITGYRTNPNSLNGELGDAQLTSVPEGAKDAAVDPNTGVLAYTLDGLKVVMTPEGRTFTTDAQGNTSYTASPGDTTWDISRDLLRVQYNKDQKPNLNPTEEEILNMSNSLSKLHPNGFQAGENLNLGNAGLAELPPGLTPPVQNQPTFAADANDPTKGQWKPTDGTNIDVANIKPGTVPTVENGVLRYTNNSGQPVEVDSTGRETTTLPNGLKVIRNKPGEAPVRYQGKDGDVFELHTSDNKWWYRRGDGDYVPLDSAPNVNNNGLLEVGEAGTVNWYTHVINNDGSHYNGGVGTHPH